MGQQARFESSRDEFLGWVKKTKKKVGSSLDDGSKKKKFEINCCICDCVVSIHR